MIHLFNKVYLKPDTNFIKGNDCIIISPKATVWKEQPHLDNINTLDFGTVHFAEETYSDLITKHFGGDEQNFMGWLLSFDHSKRLTIFCSPDALELLLFKWLKTILKNMDSDTAYDLARTYYLRYRYQWGYAYAPFVRLSQAEADVYRNIGLMLGDAATVKQLWEMTVPFSGLSANTLAQVAGIEFQIASYLNDNSWQYTNLLSDKLIAMVKKFQVRFLLDMKQDTLSRLFTLPNFDMLNQSLASYVVQHPEWTFLLDNNFLPDQYAYVEATYDMAELRQTATAQLQRLYDIKDPAILDTIKWLDPIITLDDIVQAELDSPFCRRQLGQWEYAITINVYLLAHVLNLHKQNNTAELAKYTLVTT